MLRVKPIAKPEPGCYDARASTLMAPAQSEENMKRWLAFAALALVASPFAFAYKNRPFVSKPQIKAGAAVVAITPFGQNPDWADLGGTITQSGV